MGRVRTAVRAGAVAGAAALGLAAGAPGTAGAASAAETAPQCGPDVPGRGRREGGRRRVLLGGRPADRPGQRLRGHDRPRGARVPAGPGEGRVQRLRLRRGAAPAGAKVTGSDGIEVELMTTAGRSCPGSTGRASFGYDAVPISAAGCPLGRRGQGLRARRGLLRQGHPHRGQGLGPEPLAAGAQGPAGTGAGRGRPHRRAQQLAFGCSGAARHRAGGPYRRHRLQRRPCPGRRGVARRDAARADPLLPGPARLGPAVGRRRRTRRRQADQGVRLRLQRAHRVPLQPLPRPGLVRGRLLRRQAGRDHPGEDPARRLREPLLQRPGRPARGGGRIGTTSRSRWARRSPTSPRTPYPCR